METNAQVKQFWVKRLKSCDKPPLITWKNVCLDSHINRGKERCLENQNFPKRIMKGRCIVMGSPKSSVFILVLHLLEGALSNSLIQLNNNGYEGIVIAIDPNVPEDETLIREIKVSWKR